MMNLYKIVFWILVLSLYIYMFWVYTPGFRGEVPYMLAVFQLHASVILPFIGVGFFFWLANKAGY